jgi:hypothetical protein
MRAEDRLDWRLLFETRLTNDLPAAYTGGPVHSAGARLIVSTIGSRRGTVPLSFDTPSTSALALSAAIRASGDDRELRGSLMYRPIVSPYGPVETVTDDTTSLLYDFFERAYVAVVFSYQAVEAFANEETQRLVTTPQHVNVRGRWEDLDADACERWLSTVQKIADVLPSLLGISPPRKAKWWPAFKELERLRDATVHLKARHVYPRADRPIGTFFHDLLAVRSLSSFPQTAVSVIEHLHENRARPAWLVAARELADAREPRSANPT